MPADLPDSEIETALLRAIHEFFAERAVRPSEPTDDDAPVSGRPLQVATVVLFLQMIAADHEARHDEHRTLVDAVSRVLRMDADSAAIVIRFAEEEIRTPLPRLIKLLNDRCSTRQKKSLVEGLWHLAFADAELAGHEEYFARKVAQALNLSTADLIETKIRAREAFMQSGEPHGS